jgi:ABC-type multidrug transport system ATPase subunit
MNNQAQVILCYEDLTIKNRKEVMFTVENMTVKEGESALVVSANPDGKTTLLKTIYNLSDNKSLKELSCHKLGSMKHKTEHNILYLGFYPQMFDNLSVYQNIIIPLNNLSLRLREKVMDYLHIFNLEFKSQEVVVNLSLSEKKIVELIRAALLLPKVLLIDDIDIYLSLVPADKMVSFLKDVLLKEGVIVATSRKRIKGFDNYYSFIDNKLIST